MRHRLVKCTPPESPLSPTHPTPRYPEISVAVGGTGWFRTFGCPNVRTTWVLGWLDARMSPAGGAGQAIRPVGPFGRDISVIYQETS